MKVIHMYFEKKMVHNNFVVLDWLKLMYVLVSETRCMYVYFVQREIGRFLNCIKLTQHYKMHENTLIRANFQGKNAMLEGYTYFKFYVR
jgi:hypothetical protein